MNTVEKAELLRTLYQAPEIVRVVNVWDAISTKVVADLPETKAIATAGHSIAAMYGYADGGMPLELALAGVETIVKATELPVTADLDDGYAEPGETIRRAIAIGAVGANVEDRLKPLDESVARVTAMIAAAEAEGVPFQLNARTDAIARGEGPLDGRLTDAIERGKAFLGEGAALVFIPGLTDQESVERVVDRARSQHGQRDRPAGRTDRRGVRGSSASPASHTDRCRSAPRWPHCRRSRSTSTATA